MGQRNAIRRALRREAAWRRRRSVVLLKVFLEKRFRLKATAGPALTPPAAAGTHVLDRVAGSRGGSGLAPGGGACKLGEMMPSTNAGPATKFVKTAAVTVTKEAGHANGMRALQGALEGLVDLAGREEALFRQVVGCL